MILEKMKRRVFRQRNVQQLIFQALEGHAWMTASDLADQIAQLNDGERIPPYVRNAALMRLTRRAFLEMRVYNEQFSTVIEVRMRNDAHRQWLCGSRHWSAAPDSNRPH